MYTFNDKNEILLDGEWIPFRRAYAVMGEEEWARASGELELLNWEREMACCPRCGEPLPAGKPKNCAKCGAEYWPQLSPAIVVLVTRGENRDEGLLVHARTLPGDVHALVAGFVEPGETLEECVAREVMEETGLEIEDIRYFGSQSWPYPHQLMVAFTARLAEACTTGACSSGVSPEAPSELVDFPDGELTSGGFYDRRRPEELPTLPTPPSLTRRLIDTWLRGEV